ncbi:DUF6585 family protein [Fimbriiglobus ruber]|uniref:Uncharacterized protein n=1 Tax=Fimbriiglobus ruber TaxID=1908690 RepID=A0A225E9F8_9BACT|nr:DUF6585 family protein [Fimbriiglobus ruber]OWK45057.1 hypothetical protein FRUB_01388 [Fimbriiglobus ruber]
MSTADIVIDRCREELGEPDAVFGLSPGRFRAKFALGVALVTLSLVGNYLYWVEGPAFVNKGSLLLLILPPASGVMLLWHLYRTRGLHVLAYPTGLLRVQRREVESFPWAEIVEVRVKADSGTVAVRPDDAGGVTACWLEVGVPVFQIWNGGLIVRRADGTEVKFTPVVSEYGQLVERVQRATFLFLGPPAIAKYAAGEPQVFGPFEVGWDGLRVGKNVLPWVELGDVSIVQKKLSVKRKGKWLTWTTQDLESIPNPHVLLALIELARRAARPDLPAEPNDEPGE